jgi:EAL domain-containing protein (putative c-di-GMP-specific phosphodiesterase class I)
VENSHARLRELSAEGFRLSIDDFGTGYSSLSQLHEMPVNELKVDMSFVRRIHTLDGSHIIKAIVNMGKALDLDLVAEGVEEKTTEKRLIEIGIRVMQGNLYCRAVSAEDFLAYAAPISASRE